MQATVTFADSLEHFARQFKAQIFEQHQKELATMSGKLEVLQSENTKLREAIDKLRVLHMKYSQRKLVSFKEPEEETVPDGETPRVVSPGMRNTAKMRDPTPRPPPMPSTPDRLPKMPRSAPKVLLVSQVAPSALESLPLDGSGARQETEQHAENLMLEDRLLRKDSNNSRRMQELVDCAIKPPTKVTFAEAEGEDLTALHDPDASWNGDEHPAELRPQRSTSRHDSKTSNKSTTSRMSNMSTKSVPSFFESKPAAGRMWMLLEDPTSSSAAFWLARIYNYFICASVVLTLFQTTAPPILFGFPVGVAETAVEGLFLLEVLARYGVAHSTRLFVKNPYNFIDILAATPLAGRIVVGLTMPTVAENAALHYVFSCAVPTLRLAKLFRRIQKFHLFVHVLAATMEALQVLLFLLTIFLMIFSSMIYIIEPAETVDSLPTALWMSIVTVTTVGYGDVTPETPAGRLVSAVLVLSSVLYMAMPISIIGDAFMKTWADRHRLLVMIRTRDRLKQWGYTAFDMPKLFRKFDVNDNEELCLEEFHDMIGKMGIGMPEREITELFDCFDADGSGGIDEKEFMKGLFPDTYHVIYGRRSSSVLE